MAGVFQMLTVVKRDGEEKATVYGVTPVKGKGLCVRRAFRVSKLEAEERDVNDPRQDFYHVSEDERGEFACDCPGYLRWNPIKGQGCKHTAVLKKMCELFSSSFAS